MRICGFRPARFSLVSGRFDAGLLRDDTGCKKPAKFTLKQARQAMPIHRKKNDRFRYYRCITPVLGHRSGAPALNRGRYLFHASESVAACAKKPPGLCAWHRKGGIFLDSRELTPNKPLYGFKNLRAELPEKPVPRGVVPAVRRIFPRSIDRLFFRNRRSIRLLDYRSS